MTFLSSNLINSSNIINILEQKELWFNPLTLQLLVANIFVRFDDYFTKKVISRSFIQESSRYRDEIHQNVFPSIFILRLSIHYIQSNIIYLLLSFNHLKADSNGHLGQHWLKNNNKYIFVFIKSDSITFLQRIMSELILYCSDDLSQSR